MRRVTESIRLVLLRGETSERVSNSVKDYNNNIKKYFRIQNVVFRAKIQRKKVLQFQRKYIFG